MKYQCTTNGNMARFADFICFAATAPEFTRMSAASEMGAKWDTVDGYVRVAASKGLVKPVRQQRLSKGGVETVYAWSKAREAA